jgi:hypothetical protein
MHLIDSIQTLFFFSVISDIVLKLGLIRMGWYRTWHIRVEGKKNLVDPVYLNWSSQLDQNQTINLGIFKKIIGQNNIFLIF